MGKAGESSKNPFIQVRKFRSPDHEKKSAKDFENDDKVILIHIG